MFGRDFLDMIRALNANDVRYLIVGGYAVAFYGHPRYTKDLDVWVEIAEDNAQRLAQALADFGFGALRVTAKDFLQEGAVVQLGYPPNRIDLITSVDGIDFAQCYEARVEALFDDVNVNFINLENLKRNKAASGRLQDLADLEALRKRGKRNDRRKRNR